MTLEPSNAVPRRPFARLLIGLALWLLVATPPCLAQFTLNLGYQNPAPALLGLNGQYLLPNLAIEVGLGWANLKPDEEEESDKRRATLTLLGGVNLKYLFLTGAFRPYLEGGFTLQNNYYLATKLGADLSTGPPFFGFGALIGSAPLYGYLGAVYLQSQIFAQVGVGWTM